MRTPFQRDRDRIVHATAFRRLTHKTQVFLYHEGDHYRSRLTHSLEVAQIARSIARLLALDEDLAEAMALAHDLGHPPFGHAGERALASAMAPYGGFDHNAQSLRVVTRLERKYAAFDGLNLTFEALEGLVKHNGPLRPSADPGHAVLLAEVRAEELEQALDLDLYAPAEAQVAALADDIAYNNHDIDDGLRAGLIGLADLGQVELLAPLVASLAGGDGQRAVYEINRRLITAMVADVLETSRARLTSMAPPSMAAVKAASAPVIAFSPAMQAGIDALRAFLFERVYRHERVMRVMRQAEGIVTDLFARYMAHGDDMPEAWAAGTRDLRPAERARIVADFVAGMTDRFAIGEHRRLFDATPELR